MFRYIITSVLDFIPVGELELSDITFNDPSFGGGPGFSGAAEITNTQTVEKLSELTMPDQMALYVFDDDMGQYLFGGPIFARPWNRSTRRLNIQAQGWKAWMYQKLCGMNRGTNPVSDTTFAFTNTDQFTIAQSLVNTVVNGQAGCPAVVVSSELSGVLRDLNFHGSDQKYLADQIDSMANRDNGFEWQILVEPDGTIAGRPRLRFQPSYPGRGGLNNQVLLLHQEATGGNILEITDPEESSADRRSRVWGLGAGQPPDQIVAWDEDPGVTADLYLLRETVTTYNSVTNISTLADHARAERIYRSNTLQQVTVSVGLSDPLYSSYASGDRVRLLVQDEWIDWDFSAVRVIDKTYSLGNSGDSPKPDMVKVLLDLNDTEPPETTEVV
jgi:hypothetical protein